MSSRVNAVWSALCIATLLVFLRQHHQLNQIAEIQKSSLANHFAAWKQQSVKDRDGFPSYIDLNLQTVARGILTNKPRAFFARLQQDIDESDPRERCWKYRIPYNESLPRRRIFLGSLLANEPWELFEIVATEMHGLIHGIVYVESNRTQDTTFRSFQRLKQESTFGELFGITNVQIRPYVNEDTGLKGLSREHSQREEIIKGWKEMGMGPEDIGLLADSDETFSREFLQASLSCDVPAFRYELHHCRQSLVKLTGATQVFESTPECPRHTANRPWLHPDMIVGGCLEGIADSESHPTAPRQRNSFLRFPGFLMKCSDFASYNLIRDDRYPSWNAADFRRACGGYTALLDVHSSPSFSRFTGFHFHNFFSSFNATRQKHFTYGHANKQAFEQHIGDLGEDYKMMYNCVTGMKTSEEQKFYHAEGFQSLKPNLPIYFQDEEYRKRRQAHVVEMIKYDESVFSPGA